MSCGCSSKSTQRIRGFTHPKLGNRSGRGRMDCRDMRHKVRERSHKYASLTPAAAVVLLAWTAWQPLRVRNSLPVQSPTHSLAIPRLNAIHACLHARHRHATHELRPKVGLHVVPMSLFNFGSTLGNGSTLIVTDERLVTIRTTICRSCRSEVPRFISESHGLDQLRFRLWPQMSR